MSKIERRKRAVNLPEDPTPGSLRGEPPLVDVETTYRALADSILHDPLSSPMDKLRALDAYMRVLPMQAPTIEQLTREEVANMSTEELDQLLGILTAPIGMRDAREVEREIQARVAQLEAEFEERVNARVRELVDVEAVRATIEQRAREIAHHGRPLTEAPKPRTEGDTQLKKPTPEKVVDWPPDRHPRGRRTLG